MTQVLHYFFFFLNILSSAENRCKSQTVIASQKVKYIVSGNRDTAFFHCSQNSCESLRLWFLTFYGSLTPQRNLMKARTRCVHKNLLPMTSEICELFKAQPQAKNC